MISYNVLFNVLSLVLICVVIYCYRLKISILNDEIEGINNECGNLLTRVTEIEEKLNKKDPYEDYRNEKGLLSLKPIKELRKYGKSGM